MAKAQQGKTYAIIDNGRCHSVSTKDDLVEWNESHIRVVDVTGAVPSVGDVWNGGSSFSPYVPPPSTQLELNSQADNLIFKYFKENLPLIIEALESASSGPMKASIKALNDKVKPEVAKKK